VEGSKMEKDLKVNLEMINIMDMANIIIMMENF
jgi:hypothetical protein